MSFPELGLAVLALLVTPGPTNTLLAIAGAERGWRGALRLIPAELCGYLATVVPLALIGARLAEAAPGVRLGLTLVAAAWVAYLAWSLWRDPGRVRDTITVTARHVAITTLLNPKALVFGLLLLPAPEPARLLANLALFVGLVVGVASAWAALGAALRSGRPNVRPGLPPAWRRGAALLLAGLSAWLIGRLAGLA
jgi:threonine/homoserine/homoserine lactone efflux protein